MRGAKSLGWRSAVIVASTLTLVITAYLGIGYLIGTGYSVELRYFISAKPARLCIHNFTEPNKYPVMIISGHAYIKVRLSRASKMYFSSPPHTEGNVTCRLIAGKGLYECSGNGYVYKYVGRRMEIVSDDEMSKYYYGGPALGISGTTVALYSYGFASFISLFLTLPLSLLIFYLTLRLATNLRASIALIVSEATLMAISTCVGGLKGLESIPREVSYIKIYLLHTLLNSLIFIIVALTITVLVSILKMRSAQSN